MALAALVVLIGIGIAKGVALGNGGSGLDEGVTGLITMLG